MKWNQVYWYALFLIFTACAQPPEYPNEPVIEYVGVSKKSIRQGSIGTPNDSITITIGYTDGDGNIGAPSEDDFQNNVVYIDSRNNLETFSSVPFIPTLGVGSGLSGTIAFTIYSGNSGMCCIYDDKDGEDPCTPSTAFPTDTLTYTVFIIDQGPVINLFHTLCWFAWAENIFFTHWLINIV